jgi:hypothetical protein
VQWRDAGEPSSPYVGLDQAIWAATHPSVIQVLGAFLAKASPADLTFEDEVKVRPTNIGDSSDHGWFTLTVCGPIKTSQESSICPNCTALMRAVLHGNKSAVAMLIAAGSDVNHQDSKVCSGVYLRVRSCKLFFVIS